MNDPHVEFPHEDLTPNEHAPRLYCRDGSPAPDDVAFDDLWRDHGVAVSTIANPNGTRTTISTIFLGLDHRLPGDDQPPILFETAVFDGTGLVFRARSRSEQAAREAHASALIEHVAAIGAGRLDDAPLPVPPTSYVSLDEERPAPGSPPDA